MVLNPIANLIKKFLKIRANSGKKQKKYLPNPFRGIREIKSAIYLSKLIFLPTIHIFMTEFTNRDQNLDGKNQRTTTFTTSQASIRP